MAPTVRPRWLSIAFVLLSTLVACGSPSDSATTATTTPPATTTTAQAVPTTTAPPATTTAPPVTTTISPPVTTTTAAPPVATTAPPVTTTISPPVTTTTAAPPVATTTAPPATTTTVLAPKTVGSSIFSFGYNPDPITLNVGDTIRWTNDSGMAHTTTSSGNWDSGVMASGATFSRVFDSPGTFTVFCTIHGAGVMSATVVVNP